ncbi:hypothetical protein R3W88_000641 [Solanum pinnatisectum]|uniref:Uncharacterized protein n=1 Tax=Solanum pinnatisectum TaxID=50273 RepID=A0AAV9MG55_9SOLN|nr:hypothetical protein R3W88_000641 [Solanum pinnatisectum]
MVPVTTKGKEKITEETLKRKPFTRATSQKLMGDAMKSSETTTAENRRRRRSRDVVIEFPTDDVVDVSNELSENESMDEDIPLAVTQKGKGKQVKNKGKSKSITSSVKKTDTTTKGKGKEPQKKKGPLKRKRETSTVLKKKSEQGPGTKRNKDDKEVSKQTIIDNMCLQKVLRVRVFDPEIIMKPGMDSLADVVEIQSWTHLFMTKSSILHKGQVHKFCSNVNFTEDDSLNTLESLHLDEELLGKILEIPREGTKFVVGKFCSKQFVQECSKLLDIHRAGVQKKLMKGEYQLLFEFVKKVLLPRTKKRTVASATDLFVIEAICKFEPLNIPALMLEHMHKTVVEHKGKHGMGYSYFLTKVFQHLNIPMGKGTVGTVKQSFSLSTLVECECIKGKAGPLSKMSQLVMEQDQLKHKLEEMTVLMSNKDAETALLKAQLLKAQTEGSGIEEASELRLKNAALLAQNAALQEKLINDHDEANDRLTLVIKSLSHKTPST